MYNKEESALHFSKLLQCKTVAGNDDEFTAFRGALKEMYPNVFLQCEYELIGKLGIMFRWKGKLDDKCMVLMSHYDVVPAEKGQWRFSPFAGEVSDGKIWGRGTLDTKCTLCAIMESAEALIKKGFVPHTDIYFCFGGDEETTGDSAIQIAQELKRRNINAYLVLDEGGAVVNGRMAGINHLCALVGIAEKGYMDVEFITRGNGGHSSLTSSSNPIVIMAEVIGRINGKLFKPNFSKPVKIMMDAAASHANFGYRLLMRNYWLWGKLLNKIISKKLPEINALTKTIGTVTQIFGGSAENIIPEQIRATGNFRIVTGDTVETTLNTIKKAMSDLDVEINLLSALEPSPISVTSGRGWELLSGSISKTWSDSVLIPYLMLARSDSRSYSEVSNHIYRFSPVMMTTDERTSIHGINENIAVESFYKMIDFYICLITSPV